MGLRVLIRHRRLGGVAGAEVLAEVANGDDASSSARRRPVAFDCALVTRSCYLLLLCGLRPSSSPAQRRGGANQRTVASRRRRHGCDASGEPSCSLYHELLFQEKQLITMSTSSWDQPSPQTRLCGAAAAAAADTLAV